MVTQSAQEIFQDLLDRKSEALLTRDLRAFSSIYLLPQRLEVFEGRAHLDTEADLERLYDGLCAELEVLNIQRAESVCSKAEFVDAETISGFYETRLIVKGLQVLQSYFALSTLKCVDGVWRFAGSQYAGPEKTLPHMVLGRYIAKQNLASGSDSEA